MKNPYAQGPLKRIFTNLLVDIIIGFGLVFARKSDKWLEKRTARGARWADWLGLDPFIGQSLRELSSIFAAGAPGSEIARSMMFGARPERMKAIVRGFLIHEMHL